METLFFTQFLIPKKLSLYARANPANAIKINAAAIFGTPRASKNYSISLIAMDSSI